MVQKSKQLELPLGEEGEALGIQRSGQASAATTGTERPGTSTLLEEALARPNLQRALKRVRRNKGSPGIDGMTVDELPDWLRKNWPRVREDLLAGTYQPSAVRRAMIPKPGGGERQLGIPTVLDRTIQQALLQVLQPRFDPTFSEHSHGFRPKRRAHDAVREARQYVQDGKRWVVDVDLEKFFDRVNHDVLMGRLAKRIEDRRMLRLIRRYLNAGILADGVVVERYEGTPQGGPLSPLLANVLLDEVDKELERRGHAFVRYADDLRVFVGSKRAGERVMSSLVRLFGKLRLRVNESKSAVDRATKRPLLGFGLWPARGGELRFKVARKALDRMKGRVRQLTRRIRGRSLEQVVLDLRSYLLGWRNYFQLAQTNEVFATLDRWIRHRLRAYQLKQWRRPRTVYRELLARGLRPREAARVAKNCSRWWRNSYLQLNKALPNALFDGLGLPRLAP
jgi:group II intron reverse transcriptase/maturase